MQYILTEKELEGLVSRKEFDRCKADVMALSKLVGKYENRGCPENGGNGYCSNCENEFLYEYKLNINLKVKKNSGMIVELKDTPLC